MRPMQRGGGWHAQDQAIERQLGPPQKWTRTPPRRSEGWNGWATRQGLKRNRCEIGVGPLNGKNQLERQELSQTRDRSECYSKRAGSHRVQRESTGRGWSPLPRRRICQAQKTTCRHEEVQGRWPWKRTNGQGRTKERSKNSRRPAASARTTRKNAPAAAGR